MMNGEHLKPEYIKMNPQHTVPTIDDNGFYLSESRAIAGYFVNQYGKNDSLYPKEPKARAQVDQKLYFDAGSLSSAFTNYYYPMIFAGAPHNEAAFAKIPVVLEIFDKYLASGTYAAADHLTIADLCLITTLSNYEAMSYDLSKYKNVLQWSAKIKDESAKYKEIISERTKAFRGFADKLMKK